MAERLLQTLLVNSLVFAALFAVVALVRALLGRRLSAGLSLALWAVLAVKLLLPFGFQSALSPLAWLRPATVSPIALPAATATAVTGTQTAVVQPSGGLVITPINAPAQPQVADAGEGSDPWQWVGQPQLGDPTNLNDTLPGGGEVAPAPADPGVSAVGSPVPWTLWVLLAWASGAVGVAIWLGLGRLALRRHLRSALPPPAAAVQALRACCRELGIRRPVELRLLRAGGSPAIAGLLRPVVLLDEELAMGDGAALRAVILHELSHCRGGDLWAIFGLNLLTVVYWFHPLVWALAALARRDMETRCDQRVLERLTREDQQGYVNTLLHFAGYGQALKPRVALGMGVSRKTMERRIRDMFRSRRADRLTRWVTAGCTVLMLCSGALTACMPPTGTPQLAASVAATASATAALQTDTTVAAEAPDAGTAPAVAPTVTPTATPTATTPPHRTQSYPGAEDAVTISVDADILQPGAPLPIVRLAPRGIPMEQVRKMAQVLFEGKTAYEPQVGFTKADLQDKIKECQDFIGDWDKLVAYYGGGKQGEATARSTTKDFIQRIKTYQKQLTTALDAIPRRPTDWTFHSSEYYMDTAVYTSDANSHKTQQIRMEADLEEGYLGYLDVSNLSSATAEMHSLSFNIGSKRDALGYPAGNDTDARPMTLGAEQAVAMVQAKLEAMGIQGYALHSLQAQGKTQPVEVPADITDPAKREVYVAAGEGQPAATAGAEQQQVYGYSMIFEPVYGGIPLAECLTYGMSRDKAAAGPGYGYEQLIVRVMNDRIVTLFWDSPTQAVQTEEAAATLLPLDDVLAAFQAHMQRTITREWLTHDSPENATHKALMATVAGGGVKITRIELVLYRMRDKDHKLTYRTMPVWRFYGQQSIRFTDGTGYDNLSAGAAYINQPGGWVSLIASFNAVDGSLFDEYKGY